MHLRSAIETALNWLATLALPVVLIVLGGLVAIWQLVHVEPHSGTELPLHYWKQAKDSSAPALPELASRLAQSAPQTSIENKLSADYFWLGLSAEAPDEHSNWAVEFPSRHAIEMSCWDQQTLALIGRADRWSNSAALRQSLTGFAIPLPASQRRVSLLCRAIYRGPAKISASVWTADALKLAQSAHEKTGTLIESSIGVLALSMLLMAVINRSGLYCAFVGWLLLNMRMASLSAGTDFELFGITVPPDWLIGSRHWTLAGYCAMTVALFSKLFADEISQMRSRISLTFIQAAAIFVVAASAFLSYEQTLPMLWVLSSIGIVVMFGYLFNILRWHRSAVAIWYASSSAITLLASLNEVVAAALGQRNLLGGLNSVTAALASGLLVSAAAAEHMRMGRKQKEAAQKTLKAAYDDSPIGLFTLRDDDLIVNCNAAFKAMLKPLVSDAPIRLSQLFDVISSRELRELRQMTAPAVHEFQAQLPEAEALQSEERWFAIEISTLDGEVIEGSLQEISEKVRATKRLEFLVNHDPLTECLNLRGLLRQFERSPLQVSALAYFDLDRFKLINDLYGHAAGDAVLTQVCERMRSQLGSEDLLARVGGDEFVIAFPSADVAAAKECCEKVCALISSSPFHIDTQRFTLSVSSGLVATMHLSTSSLKEVMSAADTLCRMAKKRPNERLVMMESSHAFLQHYKEELALISCLERGETPQGLFLLMQPEISLTQPFDSLNFEVLVRMRKPNGEVLPAPVIIEAAEAHGKTAIIDRWVVTTAIKWLEANLERLSLTRFVGVNLSGGSLNDESFVEDLFDLLEAHPVVTPLLCLEITETVALTDMHHIQRFIDRVQAIGAKVSLDDFGAGYSSFGYLKGLSVDALKIDGSMVKDAAHSSASMAILCAIGGLVKNLGMKSIGEFAEDLPAIKALVEAGVDYAQGYGISKPVPPERILAARSGADFIEDLEILAYIKDLQSRQHRAHEPFIESTDPSSAPGLLH